MIHGYHVIWGTYGFWLPNDPRGSWSDFVASWELAKFGKATQSNLRLEVDPLEWAEWRQKAEGALKYPVVHFDGRQASAVGTGFARCVQKSNLTVWACSVLPEHVHLILARHTYRVEQICNLLKGEATKALTAASVHPRGVTVQDKRKVGSVWAEGQWKRYLESEEDIETAIRYVEENPVKEDKPKQSWSFVTPFSGLAQSGWVIYH